MEKDTLTSKEFYKKTILIVITILIWGNPSLGAQPAPEALINRFLEANQLLAIEYFESNLENLEKFVTCLEDSNQCLNSNIHVSQGSQLVELEFNQENLIQYIQARHSEFRILVGVHSYPAIERGLALGRGRMSITPFRGSGPVIFDTRDEAGEREWSHIQNIYNGELQAIHFHNTQIQRSRFRFAEATERTMREMIQSQLTTMLQKFPFLKTITRHNPTRLHILQSFQQLKQSYINSLTHISTLEDDDRFELFGFIATLQTALESFSEQEQTLIEEHFKYIEETTTIWHQILDLVTSRYFLSMIGCWTVSVFLPPVAAICGAIGLGFAIPGIYDLVQQTMRLNDFNATGEYDVSVYSRYIIGIILSGGMYTIFARGAVPGFIRNVRSLHSRTLEVVNKIRLSPRSLLGTSRDFINGELDILRRYFIFNLKDFGSQGAVDLASQQLNGVSMRQLLPGLRNAFQGAILQIETRTPQIFLYSDILRVTRTVIP